MAIDLSQFVDGLFDSIKGFVQRSISPLAARLESVEARIAALEAERKAATDDDLKRARERRAAEGR